MRRTITLDADVAQLVQQRMRERRQTFKEAVNEAIRESATSYVPRFHTVTASIGESSVSLDRALQLAAELEDDELLRKIHGAK